MGKEAGWWSKCGVLSNRGGGCSGARSIGEQAAVLQQLPSGMEHCSWSGAALPVLHLSLQQAAPLLQRPTATARAPASNPHCRAWHPQPAKRCRKSLEGCEAAA